MPPPHRSFRHPRIVPSASIADSMEAYAYATSPPAKMSRISSHKISDEDEVSEDASTWRVDGSGASGAPVS
jgi:hypothetical protein